MENKLEKIDLGTFTVSMAVALSEFRRITIAAGAVAYGFDAPKEPDHWEALFSAFVEDRIVCGSFIVKGTNDES